MHILIFGDSTTYGAFDLKGGWVQRLRSHLDEKQLNDESKFYLVYNLGISGNTTKHLLKRIAVAAKERDEGDGEKNLVIVQIGGNDASVLKGKARTNVKEFRKNLVKITNIATKISKNVIFVGTAPVDESKTMPLNWNHSLFYNNLSRKEYGIITKEVCREKKIKFIEVFDKFEAIQYKKLLQDGLHLNSKGHEFLFNIVRRELEKIIE